MSVEKETYFSPEFKVIALRANRAILQDSGGGALEPPIVTED